MARRCLPVEVGKGQNPLTNIWMPYALADPLLFLATLNFAAAHIDIVHGRLSNPRTIAQKGETIRLINLRLQDSADIVSDTTIGAVAMLAAMEVFRPFFDIPSETSFLWMSFLFKTWKMLNHLAILSPLYPNRSVFAA